MPAPTATSAGSGTSFRAVTSLRSRTRAASLRPSGRRPSRYADMSLLLEALKKAEKAKEEAQKRARGDSGGAAGELRLEGEPAADNTRVVTRPELPDISQPLEIVSDDLAVKEPAAPQPVPQPAPSPRQQAPLREADPRSADRAAARKVFEAKFREPNPRMPFYIAMGVLGV